MKKLISLCFAMIWFSTLLCQNAFAEIEIEIDPIAFGLKGYSFHVAYAVKKTRFDIGVFALELPEDSNNENFTVSFTGYGAKWDYVGDRVDGMFWGVEAGTSIVNFKYDNPDSSLSNEETTRTLNTYGLRFGYRIGIDGFYITPWLGINSANLIGDDVTLGGETYDQQEIIFFPTVHIGYRF